MRPEPLHESIARLWERMDSGDEDPLVEAPRRAPQKTVPMGELVWQGMVALLDKVEAIRAVEERQAVALETMAAMLTRVKR